MWVTDLTSASRSSQKSSLYTNRACGDAEKIMEPGVETLYLNPFSEIPRRRGGEPSQKTQKSQEAVRSVAEGPCPLESELSPAHGARLTYEEWDARSFGILERHWCVLGGRGVLATLGSARLSLSPPYPCLPAGADPGSEEVN